MENSFDFKSRIATSREESEKLLSLGLKKETADMIHQPIGITPFNVWDETEIENNFFPAWSLYRLMEIAFPKGVGIVAINGMFNNIINLVEKRINSGTFPKEYLNE